MAIYLFTINKRGISSVQLGKMIGVTQRTAWFMLHRLREALKEENNIMLKGVVEADETFIMPKIGRDKRLQAAKFIHDKEQDRIHGLTKKQRLRQGIKQKRGRKKGTTKEVVHQMKIDRGGKAYRSDLPSIKTPFEQGAVVFGMMEREGRIVLKRLGTDIRCITKENIFSLLQKYIESNSTLITDENKVYQDTTELPYNHFSVNHTIGYVIDDIHTNGIENVWKHLKKLIDSTYFHVSKHHFVRYLDEYTYRWNRRCETEKNVFESFFSKTIGSRLTLKRLKQKEVRTAA
jgi:hypothetical protein